MLRALQHSLGQLLDEQRHAIGLRDDPIEQRGRQDPFDNDPLGQLRCLLLRQPPQGDQAGDRKADPRRLEFRAKRHNQQNGQARQLANRLVQQLKRTGIRPMGIFEQHENGLPASAVRQYVGAAPRRSSPSCAAG